MENTWRVEVRTGWIIGLAIAVVLVAATVGLVVWAMVTPLSIRVFLMGLGACLTLGLAIRVLYQLWGLINASYELDRNGLIIHWGPVEHQIPMGSVREVLSGAKLEELHVRPSLRWPGYAVAIGRSTNVATILFYGTKAPRNQAILRTDAVAYGVSPADLDAFLVALRERLEMGPTQEIEESSTHPGFLDWPIWHDRWALGMLLGSVVALVLLVGLICWRFPYLPPEIALRFSPAGAPLLLAQASRIFYFAFLGTTFVLLNGGLGLFFYQRERPVSYFLWSGLIAAMGGLWAGVISILLMQS